MHMKRSSLSVFFCVAIVASSALATVNVNAPTNGSVDGSPVHYIASATTGCAKGVASMGVYVDVKLLYVANGSHLDQDLNIATGKHDTVVAEWAFCGGGSYRHETITVS